MANEDSENGTAANVENHTLRLLKEMRVTMDTRFDAMQDDMKASFADMRAEVANLRAETRRGMADLVHDVREVKVTVAALNQRVANVETSDR